MDTNLIYYKELTELRISYIKYILRSEDIRQLIIQDLEVSKAFISIQFLDMKRIQQFETHKVIFSGPRRHKMKFSRDN